MAHTEKKLFRCYVASSILLTVSIVGFSIPWGHWSYTLDRCVNDNCGCILYGKTYSEAFSGGSKEYCQFVTFGQIPLLVVSVVLAFYHGVRAYIRPRLNARKNMWRGNPLLSGSRRKKTASERSLVELEPDPPSLCGSISLVATAVIALALLLAVLGFFLDGYFASCNEYRRVLVKYLQASGRVAGILNNRLICPSIFDFMDYLQPERRLPDHLLTGVRKDRINTGVSLMLVTVSLLANSVAWIAVFVLNVKLLFARMGKMRS